MLTLYYCCVWRRDGSVALGGAVVGVGDWGDPCRALRCILKSLLGIVVIVVSPCTQPRDARVAKHGECDRGDRQSYRCWLKS